MDTKYRAKDDPDKLRHYRTIEAKVARLGRGGLLDFLSANWAQKAWINSRGDMM
jgi:hypothetical protein